MKGALKTMILPVPKPELHTRENKVTMGERTERKLATAKYECRCLLYADETALFFKSRAYHKGDASCLYEHLLKSGLTMHIGTAWHPGDVACPSKKSTIVICFEELHGKVLKEAGK
jgi:hypothetical protein